MQNWNAFYGMVTGGVIGGFLWWLQAYLRDTPVRDRWWSRPRKVARGRLPDAGCTNPCTGLGPEAGLSTTVCSEPLRVDEA